jgi:hypothetical protein
VRGITRLERFLRWLLDCRWCAGTGTEVVPVDPSLEEPAGMAAYMARAFDVPLRVVVPTDGPEWDVEPCSRCRGSGRWYRRPRRHRGTF